MIVNSLDLVYDELKKENVNIYDKYDYVNKIKTKNKVKRLSLGRIWINCIFPDDFELIDMIVDEKVVSSLIKKLINTYTDPLIITNTITKLNEECFKLGSIIPSTFDINSLILPDFIIKKRKELIVDGLTPDEFNKRVTALGTEYLEYLKEHNSGVYDIIKSGAKGNEGLFGSLMIAKGSTMDIEGNISKPILHSYNEGFDLEEYYRCAAEARYTQYMKSVASQEPGYMSRRIVFSLSNILLDNNDCKTKKYLKLKITKSMLSRILGRYMVNDDGDLELIENSEKLLNKIILLRSPIYCKSQDGVCKICFGQLAEKVNSKHIGILSAGVFNDAGVNSAMKLRHSSSFVNTTKVDFVKDIIHA